MRPPGRHRPVLSEWERLGLLRAGLGLAMAAYALTYRAPASHPAPGSLRPVALALALLPVMGGAASLARSRWGPRRVAMGALLGDAAAVLSTLALYAFDPRRVVVAFVLVVQAEAGVVLGLPGVLWAWGVIGAASAGIEAAGGGTSGMPVQPIEVTIQLAVGVLLALGGGFLSRDLLGERRVRAEEKEAELRLLAEAEERYRALVEQIPVVAYIDAVDRMSSALYVSPRVEALLGYPREDWTSDPGLWEKLLHPEDRDRVLAEHLLTNATGEPFRQEYRMRGRDGRIVWVRDEAVLLYDASGIPRHWQGVLADITEAKDAEARLAFLAYHDKLTGLPDRAVFDQELALALARARRRGLAVGVLFLDLDRFKAVNERFGHAGGDAVLRSVAARLRGAVRDTDLVTRHGGDEFLVLVADLDRGGGGPQVAPLQVVLGSIAERIHAAMAEPLSVGEEALHVSASIGISVFPATAPDEASLLKQADAAMYEVKREGRGTGFYVRPD